MLQKTQIKMSVKYKSERYDVYLNGNNLATILRSMTLVCSSGYCPELLYKTIQLLQLQFKHFYFAGNTLLSDVAGIVRPVCCTLVAMGRFCNKIPRTVLQNVHRIELFATCCRHWGYLATSGTAFDFCHRTALRMMICQCK